MIFFSLIFFLCWGQSLRAETPLIPRLTNYDLGSTVAQQPWRKLPRSDVFALATDVQVWKSWGNEYDYYHGAGYWVDFFSEYKVHPDLVINGKLSFVNGTTSYGYNGANRFYQQMGVTWTPGIFGEGWSTLMRFFDLDRQTLGAGLWVDDLELSGFFWQIRKGDYFYQLYLPGTGGVLIPGDLFGQELFARNQDFDFGISSYYFHQVSYEVSEVPGVISIEKQDVSPTTGIFIRSRPDQPPIYGFELGVREGKWAGAGAVGYQNTTEDNFKWRGSLHYHQFQRGFAGVIAGRAQKDFLPYNVIDRPYDNPINELKRSDDVLTVSARLALRKKLGDHWYFESLNEAGRIQYRQGEAYALPTLTGDVGYTDHEDFIWVKQSFGYCPYSGEPYNCIYFYGDNRSSAVLDPNQTAKNPRGDEGSFFYTKYYDPKVGIEAFSFFSWQASVFRDPGL